MRYDYKNAAGTRVYHAEWMVEIPAVRFVDTDTLEWEHLSPYPLTSASRPCLHVAKAIRVMGRLIIINPIPDNEVPNEQASIDGRAHIAEPRVLPMVAARDGNASSSAT